MQREHAVTPTYVTIEERGPDHAKMFLVAAVVDGRKFAPAWGRNKKEAEQRAAMNALCELEDRAIPFNEIDSRVG
jgi:ribonuclease-3